MMEKMEKCFDIGTIQAFLDGELSMDLSQKVTRHIALCDDCAAAFAEAEDETAIAFSALEREYDTLVPTHRLWTKINDSIAVEKKQSSVWQRFLHSISVLVSSPSMAVAAGVLIVFGIFAALFTLQNDPNMIDVAVENRTTPTIALPFNSIASNGKTTLPNPPFAAVASTEPRNQNPKVYPPIERETPRRNNLKNLVVKANYTENRLPKTKEQKPKTVYADYLPGEESYIKTIANLTQTVNLQKDEILRPSAQISFERDLAVVNDAIAKMKKEVQKNPRNESAKQVLYSSYQNKIDLLNSVAEKNELMASLK
ncbi:MAG: hypothetical protein M3Q99_06175 [Acidobacteriota bacterium]|nr:hypothetical protein [Acidobacteriota bacterium]